MPKKTATTKSTKTRSNTRAHASSPAIVTSKAQTPKRKRTLSRRSKRQTHTAVGDHAVPETVPSLRVIPIYSTLTRPFVMTGDHALSPFILSLKATFPTPTELLEETRRRSLRVNLLDGHPYPQPTRSPDLTGDLVLSPADILEQGTPTTLPKLPKLHTHISQAFQGALRYNTSSNKSFSSDAFIAHTLPEDIFAYFDFPEEEEGEEMAHMAEMAQVPLDVDDLEETVVPFSPSHSWQRAVASFIGLSFLFVLPLHAMNVVQDVRETKTDLEHTGLQAVSLLSSGAQAALARDVPRAQSDFKAAGRQFQTAKNSIDDLGVGTNVLLSVLPVTQSSYTSSAALIEAGKELSIAASRLSDGYATMEQELFPTPLSRLTILETYLSSAVVHLKTAQSALDHVDLDAVPKQHQETLVRAQTSLPALVATIEEFETHYTLAKHILGANGSKRYLIVFQNNTEIRPTGGFIGSFAEIKIRDGNIEHLNIPGGGSYDLQGSLQENLRAPEPLQLLSARWEFQDGNWFPDFPTSARQLMQFYQDAGGPSVDGVLAVNATFISNLIGLLGPIQMEAYGLTVNEENFIFEAQKIVEYEYDKEANTPKAFIGDLAPKLVERTIEKTSEDFLAIVDSLNLGLSSKDLQLYLTDETLQRQIIKQGWGGELKQTHDDYLMIVDTNLGGGKTDGVIEQKVDVQVDIDSDGTITNTVKISRTHHGIQGLLFTGVNNVDYLRVYVPKGSTLLEATGFSIPDESLFDIPDEEWTIDDDLAYGLLTTRVDPHSGTIISEEQGKAVFGNWVQTMPGSTSTVTVRYTLPYQIKMLQSAGGIIGSLKSLVGMPQTDQYSLTIQKQPGILDRTTQIHVNLPEGLNPLWTSHDSLDSQITNDTDALFAILFESL
ncbi:DUF4012 domain-containing protein [Candidatus Uhrbacteria bacterium]|nr:DUF4012 domain-containing protein [Candidatus Uhrbacteria bacterium]